MIYNYPKITYHTLEQILYDRFQADGFLTLKDLPSPTQLKDMDRATARIVDAIKKREKIVLIGDYDVDGVISTTLMKLFFDEIDIPLETIIPNRFKDGYGLSPTIIPQIEGYDLAITVDNGISAVDAATMCYELGIDLIITDHHIPPPKIPNAYAIVDQKQEECLFPYEEICGAQIAWYLIASLKKSLVVAVDIKSYLEFVTIAIIADMMPLKHINRVLVQAGLQILNQSSTVSMRAFKEYLSKESLSSEDIAFQLAPILNSAGRMSDAIYAVEFLTSSNIYDARSKLEKLVELNNQRKETEQNITQLAIKQVDDTHSVIVVHGKEWHEGVVGIVAARVSREFEKPAIVLSQSPSGRLKGSGRSFGECDLFEITSECREYMDRFGGHKAAIGLSLSLEKLTLFKNRLQESYKKREYKKLLYDPQIVGELGFEEITFDLTHLINQYEPYGQENHRPKFISKDVKILQIESMGRTSEHLRFALEHNGVIFVGVKFKSSEIYKAGDLVTIIYTINENHFRGDISLQLLLDKIYN